MINYNTYKKISSFALISLWIFLCTNIFYLIILIFNNFIELPYQHEVTFQNSYLFEILNYFFIVISIFTAITFLIWFWKSYQNLNKISIDLLYPVKESVTSWFIPILCLFQPYLIMHDLIEKTNGLLNKNKDNNIIQVQIISWWSIWLVFCYGQIFFNSLSIEHPYIFKIIGVIFAYNTISIIKKQTKNVYLYNHLSNKKDINDYIVNQLPIIEEKKHKYKSNKKSTNLVEKAQESNFISTKTKINELAKSVDQIRKEELKRVSKIVEIEDEKKSNNEILRTTENQEQLFVNYNLNLDHRFDNYPIFKYPKKGVIIRSHQNGRTQTRGYTEENFQKQIQKYFGDLFDVSGNIKLNTKNNKRPYEPDIAIIDNGSRNIRIDIEIDEPYDGITREPTHCAVEDNNRDQFFIKRGWIVIRFSEIQIFLQESQCIKFIYNIIKDIYSDIFIPKEIVDIPDLYIDNLWNFKLATEWAKINYREKYLRHNFEVKKHQENTNITILSEVEKEEEKKVIKEQSKYIPNTYKQKNNFERDNRIFFNAEIHEYYLDNRIIYSVGSIIENFFPEFDTLGKSYITAKKKIKNEGRPLIEENIINESYRIAREWRENGLKAANDAMKFHKEIEIYFTNKKISSSLEFNFFLKFIYDHVQIKPYRTNWHIFDDEYNFAGTIDLISRIDNNYEIYDWKRSKSLVNDEGIPIINDVFNQEFGKGDLNDIPNTDYWKNCIQQNIYRYILEKNYNIKISNMFIIVLHPKYNSYFKIKVPIMDDIVKIILNQIK